MITKIFIPLFIITLSSSALAVERLRCAPTSDVVPEGKTLIDYQAFFTVNKIIPQTSLSLNFIEQFKNEFEKFPASLHRELIQAGNKIHIMEGTGVTVDPTWDASFVNTFDGRSWDNVPGGGGSTARGYAKSPTRIVINHLYNHHGSADMFLHEHGHSLDSIRDLHGISRSSVWSDLLAEEPATTNYLLVICGAYCTDNIEEGFAELFANYHGCAETREQMERDIPKTAEFFKRLTSTKNLDHIWEDAAVAVQEVPAPVQDGGLERAKRRVMGIFGRIIHGDE